MHLELVTQVTQGLFTDAEQIGQDRMIGQKPLQLRRYIQIAARQSTQTQRSLMRSRPDRSFIWHQEPGSIWSARRFSSMAHAKRRGIADVPDDDWHPAQSGFAKSDRSWHQRRANPLSDSRPRRPLPDAQGFLQGFLKVRPTCMDFAERISICVVSQRASALRIFRRAKRAALGHPRIDRRLEGTLRVRPPVIVRLELSRV